MHQWNKHEHQDGFGDVHIIITMFAEKYRQQRHQGTNAFVQSTDEANFKGNQSSFVPSNI